MVTDFYWPFVGGVEQHVRRLGLALAGRGHEIAVATLGNQALAKFECDGRVRVYRISSVLQRVHGLFASAERPWAPPFPDPTLTAGLWQIIRQESPDIVHGHDWLARSFLPLKKISKARFVVSLHYYTLSCAKKSLMYKDQPCSGPGLAKCLVCSSGHYGMAKGIPVTLANQVMSARERAAVDMFLPVSQAAASGNGLTEGDRFQVIPNFMPVKACAGEEIGSYLAQLPDEPFLLFVGDLRRDKGLDVLLRAYARLKKAPPLVMIGKVWPETPEVFPPKAIVLRNWPNEAVLAAWARSLVAIVPSVWPEPFGIVIIEAMASGRPVIASNTGGISDIVEDGVSGLLVPPGDDVALGRSIERLLADPELRDRLGQSALKRAADFKAAAVVPRIEQVYMELWQKQSLAG